MYIKYKNKEFVGFDEVRHKDLYNRYNNLKKIKEELMKDGFTVEEKNVYKNIFDRYYFYDFLNKKITELICLYKKENLTGQIDKINLKYRKEIEKIVDSGQNKNQLHIFVRLFWALSFFKEYFIYSVIIIRKNIVNGFKKGRRIN